MAARQARRREKPRMQLVLRGAAPANLRAVLRRWALAGAGSGVAIGALRAPFAWQGDGVAANIGNMAGHMLIFTLLALGAGWMWQRRQAS